MKVSFSVSGFPSNFQSTLLNTCWSKFLNTFADSVVLNSLIILLSYKVEHYIVPWTARHHFSIMHFRDQCIFDFLHTEGMGAHEWIGRSLI